jgi:hypothetical protein
MSATRLTPALLILAAILYLGVTRPARQDLAAVSDEYRKTGATQAVRQARLSDVERIEQQRQRALTLLALAPVRTVPSLRRHLLAQLSGLPLSDIHLDVRTASVPASAEAKITAQGDFSDLVALSSRLARVDAGLALKQVTLARAESDEHVKLTLTVHARAGQP